MWSLTEELFQARQRIHSCNYKLVKPVSNRLLNIIEKKVLTRFKNKAKLCDSDYLSPDDWKLTVFWLTDESFETLLSCSAFLFLLFRKA